MFIQDYEWVTENGRKRKVGHPDLDNGIEIKTLGTSQNAYGAMKNYLASTSGKKGVRCMVVDNSVSLYISDDDLIEAAAESWWASTRMFRAREAAAQIGDVSDSQIKKKERHRKPPVVEGGVPFLFFIIPATSHFSQISRTKDNLARCRTASRRRIRKPMAEPVERTGGEGEATWQTR